MVFCFKYNAFCDQLSDKTKKIDNWIKRKCQRNSIKLLEEDDVNLKEIKYIKKVECHLSDYKNEANDSDKKLNNVLQESIDKDNLILNSQDNNSLSIKENLNENLNKNIESLKNQKNLENCSSKNDWEFYYVIDNDEKKIFDKKDLKKQKNDQTKNKKIDKRNLYKNKKGSKINFENLNLSDLEWDDFEEDSYSFFDEDDLLIK